VTTDPSNRRLLHTQVVLGCSCVICKQHSAAASIPLLCCDCLYSTVTAFLRFPLPAAAGSLLGTIAVFL
jgi:hypothetical protein